MCPCRVVGLHARALHCGDEAVWRLTVGWPQVALARAAPGSEQAGRFQAALDDVTQSAIGVVKASTLLRDGGGGGAGAAASLCAARRTAGVLVAALGDAAAPQAWRAGSGAACGFIEPGSRYVCLLSARLWWRLSAGGGRALHGGAGRAVGGRAVRGRCQGACAWGAQAMRPHVGWTCGPARLPACSSVARCESATAGRRPTQRSLRAAIACACHVLANLPLAAESFLRDAGGGPFR